MVMADELVKIKILTGGSSLPPEEEDPVIQTLEDRLDVDLNYEITSELEQKLNILIASGDWPDVFQIPNRNYLVKFAKQGVLLHLDSHLKKMDNVEKVVAKKLWKVASVNNDIYAIPKRPYIPYDSLIIRKDWLENLGLEPPANLEELMNVCKDFTYEDPDGNGKDDTYAYTGEVGDSPITNAFPQILGSYGVANGFMLKDGELIYGLKDPGYKKALTYIKKMIDAGVVDPEIATNKSRDGNEKMYQGKAGIIAKNLWEYFKPQWVEQYKAVNPETEFMQLAPPEGPAGRYNGALDVAKNQGIYGLSSRLANNPEKLDKVLEFLNYIADGKGNNLICLGVEGVHHKIVDGNIKMIEENKSEVGHTWMLQIMGRNDVPYLSAKFPWSKELLEFVADLKHLTVCNSIVTPPETINVSELERFINEELLKFVYGKRPLEEYDDFIKELDNYGLQEYIDAAKQQAREMGYIQ